MSRKAIKMHKEIILWGGTGQAKVVRPIVEYYGSRVVAVFDDTVGLKPPFRDIKLYCGWQGFQAWAKNKNLRKLGFCITIGNPHGRVRLKYHRILKNNGLIPATVIHPTAWIADSAVIGEGAQVLAGVIISEQARIGRQCIINTKASVDHEDILGDGVEISPGATLCGGVQIGINAWIGAGATVLPKVKIGADAIIGAGAVVIRDVPAATTVVGVPASAIRRRGRVVRQKI